MGKIDKSHAPAFAVRDADRESLARCIEARNELAATVAALQSAVPRAQAKVNAGYRAVEDAENAVPIAKAAAAAHLVAQAVGDAGEAPPTVEAARRAAAAAADDLDVAKVARDTLRRRLADTELSLGMAQRKVETAALAVLGQSPAIGALVAEAHELQRHLIDKCAAVNWLMNHHLVSTEPVRLGPFETEVPLAVTVSQRFASPPSTWRGLLNDGTIAGAGPWQAAYTALLSSADAVLPGEKQ